MIQFCLEAAFGPLLCPPAPLFPSYEPTLSVSNNQISMRINTWDGRAHDTLHSSGFFRNTERFLAKIWNPRFATTVANVAPPPQHDLGDVNPLLRELAQDFMLQGSKSPIAKSQAEVLYIWKVLSILQNAVTWACSPQD